MTGKTFVDTTPSSAVTIWTWPTPAAGPNHINVVAGFPARGIDLVAGPKPDEDDITEQSYAESV